jgi:hypothetical protein
MGDALESRAQFGTGGQVVRFSGEDLTSNLLGFVQSLTAPTGPIPSEEADRNEPLRQLRVRRNSGRAMREASVEIASSTILVRTLIDELSGFENMLLTAIVDPESLVNGDLRDKGTEPGTHSKIDRQKSLIQQLPFLVDRCDEVCHQLSLPLRPPAATWSPVSVFEYIPTLIGVLTEPLRRSVAGSLHVLTNGPSMEGFSQSILELIKNATVDRGWTVSIGFPRNTKAQLNLRGVADSLASLREFVASPRLRLWELSTPAVVSALVMDDLVFLGIGDWMIAGLQNSTDARNCALMIESRNLAENLRSCFTNAKEVLAYGRNA